MPQLDHVTRIVEGSVSRWVTLEQCSDLLAGARR
jgi:hypothetical protein